MDLGGRLEDGFSCGDDRPRNHFFDPAHGGAGLTVLGREWGKVSPSWALAPKGSIQEQQNSLQNAKDSLYEALTKPTAGQRKASFGALFQTLGMVIHHLQDMAQPEHVRNDEHFTPPKNEKGAFASLVRLPDQALSDLVYRYLRNEVIRLRDSFRLVGNRSA